MADDQTPDKGIERASGGGTLAPREDTSEQHRSWFADPFGAWAGFWVSFRTMFRKRETEMYPEEKRPTQPRFHGRHQLNRHPDGLEKCVGCELCAWACPADAIFVEGGNNVDVLPDGSSGRFSPGERYGRVYQINYLRCIFCGLCIEACPTRALTMTNFYELAGPTRAGLIYEKDQLLAPLGEGMVQPPHPMVDGMEERDYYLGKVTRATSAQEEFARERDQASASTPVEGKEGEAR